MTEEDELYAQALDEVTTKKGLDKAIWARALVETKGNEPAATATYISNRVKALLTESQHLSELAMAQTIIEAAEVATISCPECHAIERIFELNLRPDSDIYVSNFGYTRIDGLEIRKAICFPCEVVFEWAAYMDGSIEYFGHSKSSWVVPGDVHSMLVEANKSQSPAAQKLKRLTNKNLDTYWVLFLKGFVLIFGLVAVAIWLAVLGQWLT